MGDMCSPWLSYFFILYCIMYHILYLAKSLILMHLIKNLSRELSTNCKVYKTK